MATLKAWIHARIVTEYRVLRVLHWKRQQHDLPIATEALTRRPPCGTSLTNQPIQAHP